MAFVDPNAHWRNSARPIKFFFLDGRAVFPFMLFLLHITWTTFAVAAVAAAFFSVLARYGISPIIFCRMFRGVLAGSHKTAQPWWL